MEADHSASPAFCNEGDPEKLRWILAHELTHLRRRDAWGCLLLALGGALYFHVPWFWWMKRHVRLAQEYLADAAAARIANAVEYAQYLVSLTTLTTRPTLASSQAAGVFESPSDLYRRVHMLLHQRNVIERGAPRWWTLTAAASFLTLAACTAGVQLYANEPIQDPAQDVVLKIVASDDDDKGTDKKKTETKTIRVTGKALQGGDGKTIVWTTDDDKGKPGVVQWQGVISPEKQKALEEALKKVEKLLEKSSKQLDENTRTQLEEVKKSLKTLKETNKVVWQGQFDAAKDAQATARVRLAEALKNKEDLTKAQVELAFKQAAAHRDEAIVAEKLARAAQEKALVRWKEAKNSDDKDTAIKELEKAIAEKERALKALKSGEAKTVRGFDVKPLLQARDAVASSGKGRLGVVTAEIDSALRGHLDLADGQGLMLNEVIDPSPAWNQGNGLRSSDILVEFAGKKVPSDTEKFRELVGKLDAGTYSAIVFRKGKKLTIGGIKLPAVEKNKKVVLEGKLFDAATVDLVNIAPQLDKVAAELVLSDEVKTDGRNLIKLNVSPDVMVLGDAFKAAQGDHLKALKDHHLALELAQAHPLKGDVVLAKPIEGTITVDGKGTVHLDPVHGVTTVDGKSIKLDAVNRLLPAKTLTSTTSKPLHLVTTVAQPQGSSKPRLGVSLEEVPEAVASQIELSENRGLFVSDVTEGSAAQKAGILKNDILIEFADKPVTRDHPAFTKMIKELKPGKYTATVIRKGKEIRIRGIELADAKAATEEKRVKAKEWVVEGDGEKAKEEENAKPKARAKKEKEKEDFFPNAGGNRFKFVPAQGNMSVTVNNDQFTAKKTDGDRTITVTGKMNNGKTEVKNINIKNDDGEKSYKAVKDVPEENRADVEKMLTSFKGNAFQWNGNNNLFLKEGQLDKQLEGQLKLFEKSMKQLGEGNPGLENMERELERLREQLKKIRGIKEDENK
ncbi:MAG: M56 family metallopeptidase [Gemmatales bacterium]